MQLRMEDFNTEIHGGEGDNIDDRQSSKEGFLNLKETSANEGDGRCSLKGMLMDRVDEENSARMENGPLVERRGGLDECDGLLPSPNGTGGSRTRNMTISVSGSQLASAREMALSGQRVLTGKRHKRIEDCYPKKLEENCMKQGLLVTARSKSRQGRREMAQKADEEKKERVGSDSISDGCIAHRNKVIQNELLLHEVRKIIRVGKELGIEIQGNEEEVESRLLELEERDEERGRNLGRK
ncbi:hypothetical protein SLE2022_137130 [Rubroshorea leprosula]